ncbi:MAG TPA: dephospho-CoA kinase [Cyclobacteriaceae bacterium]
MSTLQVGITGGIGSGKSLVCKIFQCLGVPTYDADSRAKYVMTTDTILVEQIQKEFGTLSYNPKGVLNRKYLADTVFSDPGQLEKLNCLVHPRVAVDYSNWVVSHSDTRYVIKEAALLFESGSANALDKIIAVYAPEAVRIQRVLKRDVHRTEQALKEVIQNQMNEEEKRDKADYVILNDDSLLVIPQVLQLHKQFSAAC